MSRLHARGAEEGVEEVVLLDPQQRQLAEDGSDSRGGQDVATIVLQHRDGSCRHPLPPTPPSPHPSC